MSKTKGFTYRDAGVDVEAADQLVDRIRRMAAATNRPEVIGEIGGFGALFRLQTQGLRDPVLVSSTDGVGTKLRVAFEMGVHDTVGIDLVAMVVNDLLPQAAEPLFFLDYFATGHLEPGVPEQVLTGIREGCIRAGCALIGGETAEMPDSYPAGEYDLAGFAVGLVEQHRIPNRDQVREGDLLIGLASSGLHSNGYSLVRRVLLDRAALDVSAILPELGPQCLGSVLLEPTRIYCKSVLAAFRNHEVRGAAHITGGSFEGKLPRIIPDALAAEIDRAAWRVPPIFQLLVDRGVDPDDAWKTFNMGVGMVLVVPPTALDAVLETLTQHGEQAFPIGYVVPRGAGAAAVRWRGPAA